MSAVIPERFGAMPDYRFEVIEFTNGLETIHLVGSYAEGQQNQFDLHDLDRLAG